MLKRNFLLAGATAALFFSEGQAACDILLEAQGAYFYPLNSRTRDIYSGGGVFGLELSVESWWNIFPWISAGYMHKNGKSIGEMTSTSLTYIPLAVGLKYVFCGDCWRPYIGAGFAASYIHTNDHSDFVKKHRSKWGYGFIAKGGCLVYFSECWFFDIFIDYTWMKRSFGKVNHPFTLGKTADLSNLSIGGGIGVNF